MRRTTSLAALAAWMGLAAAGCASEPAEAPLAVEPTPASKADEAQSPAPEGGPTANTDKGGGEQASPASPADLAQRTTAAIERGVAFLRAQQADDGSWAEGNVGVTALAAEALLESARPGGQDEPVRRAVEYLVARQADDGSIGDVGLVTYTTSIALMVLVKADREAYATPIEKAKAYLIEHQWDEPESIDQGHPWYGGAGYGQHERPDLSNASFFLEAMHQAGVPPDHPLWAKARVFLSRTQDRSESNDAVFVGTDSGGFIYSPHGGGESKAGTVDLPGGRKGLKAYASMTYAGFKSFVYAGLARDDPRVQAALDWIRRHWTFEENPELGQQGLYYYYLTASRALAAWGEDTILDARRQPHHWRAELADAILRRQQADGSWFNEADRWFEGRQIAVVPTSYSIIALVQCL